ncbi:MAG TPA: GNAT family N-acetyltransferase, partial [Puia sp.]|nr:GNAT family N-acetyltransferase [Puia sp.]
MKEMNNQLIKNSFNRSGLFGVPACTYRVERIDHVQKHLYADLFNQYRLSRRETAVTHPRGSGWFDGEPVVFIVLTNNPSSVPVGFIRLYTMSSSFSTIKATIVNDLYVLPDYRNNGAALKLTEAAVKFAIQNKSAFIRLEILQENHSA